MKNYWKSIEEKNQKVISKIAEEKDMSQNTIIETLLEVMKFDNSTSRRDFLKLGGFSLAAATLAASCEAPINKSIPFLIKPEEVVSGIANYYASSLIDGSDYCSILVKTREGRPIKIEGNELSTLTKGGTNARVQASVLSLYDTERLKEPLHKNSKTSWGEADNKITPLLNSINTKGSKIVILSSTIISPSTNSVYKAFVKKFPNTQIVYYDAISASAILMGNKKSFNRQVIPDYRFDKADIIVSFGADFLGTWLSPIEYTKQYVQNRKLNGKSTMSKHIQFETGMSLTGSNADERIPIKPSEEGIILINIYNQLAKINGSPVYNINVPISPVDIKPIVNELWTKREKSLIISNSNDIDIQILVNATNYLLGNYLNTIDLDTPLYVKQGIDSEMEAFVIDMEEGNIDALIINNVNPAYDYQNAERFKRGLTKLKLSISLANTLDETAALVDYVCPDNHFLESWNDAEPKRGFFSLAQPTIHKLFNTRASQESLLKWIGENIDYHNYIQKYWEEFIFPLKNEFINTEFEFRQFWNKSLQEGVFEIPSSTVSKKSLKFDSITLQDTIYTIVQNKKSVFGDIELQLSESVAIGHGKHANNPWLQELPDPISKICWDNYATISPIYASENGLQNGDIVTIISDSAEIEIPVLLQPGQAKDTISIALGYGRENAGKVGNKVGKNVFQFGHIANGNTQYYRSRIKISKTGKTHLFALTQTHHSMEGRAIVRETTLDNYIENHSSGNEMHEKYHEKARTLYKAQAHIGYHWGLSIDLNACTGCGNCVIACQAENNVPVIGKDEVRRRRIMHWMRIDRYYSDSIENPQVYHQPIMCQHCDKAPCENVCPVSATMHSNDGLNHIAYNRCVGTRYCMNNCPYKVRRFNWYAYSENEKFDFHMNSELGRMVLNPDVVVRSRGVVEKCSLCIQRIQEGVAKAKLENRLLIDGDIKPACLQSCPADALVFGNINDENSKLSLKHLDKRNYHLLEELSILPSVGYLTKVRNKPNIKA
ncbi:MAG: molybdopterin oxidoreductase [Bacteroidetes bacterium]|nr:MAG: molybdopterin oxidoreductase [Bacteroidota bacterium]